jgi:cytochrome c-type biogenesis protein CcmE
VELRTQLASHPATFVTALTEKLMMYALNRQLEYFDMPQIRAIVRAAAKDNYKLSSIVLGIVDSDSFRKQASEAAPNVVAAK